VEQTELQKTKDEINERLKDKPEVAKFVTNFIDKFQNGNLLQRAVMKGHAAIAAADLKTKDDASKQHLKVDIIQKTFELIGLASDVMVTEILMDGLMSAEEEAKKLGVDEAAVAATILIIGEGMMTIHDKARETLKEKDRQLFNLIEALGLSGFNPKPATDESRPT